MNTSNNTSSPTGKPHVKSSIALVIGLVTALIIGITLGVVLSLNSTIFSHITPITSTDTGSHSNKKTEENKPLYWVAPMDANYRRDQPGQSPMGMDLIPYYGNQSNGGNSQDEGAGTIKVSPNVINNLGVRTATATYGELNTLIETVGYVTFDEDKLSQVHPRIEGWIEKMHVNAIGDPVKKGQPLYDIYSPELVNAQEELLIALDSDISRLISSAENRLIALQIPQKMIDGIKKNKKAKQSVTFYAPQSGVIDSLTIREGLYVTPATMLLSIVDLSQVWVKAEIFEQDVTRVNMGDNATMQLDFLPAKQWQGKVAHIHPMLNAKTRTGIARLHFDNSKGLLKPNMFANIAIEVNNSEPVLQVPREAVIRTGAQDRVVLALGDGYFKSVAVQIGRSDRHHIEIISGLSEGEKVVSSAQFLLDSESSKSSDFKRMDAEQNIHTSISSNDTSTNKKASSATVHGTVTSVMPAHRMVTIDREAIEKWNREPATVDFIVSETVDMSLFTVDAYLMFTFEVSDGEFIIISAMPMTQGAH
ncbi:efflux RND transporter periplasmic adaptor subunit [Colwellia echini]|uniref:Efflux RND transporter periplasmic adaptor subunit n=1 Tax=Colwellia echini TaxID=1982103 RepID=A0ABY3MWY0_9GAMM|nr:efflux RND transporter periplasmic adaptor subunit [Colwellia echini]TYK65706.1 efflux RND transporter periplasmic adaptor subunit [Colwellia echini]